MSTETIVSHVLDQTEDTLLKKTLAQLGIKASVSIEGAKLSVNLQTGFPHQFLQSTLLPVLKKNLETALPAFDISVNIESFIKAHRTQLTGKGLRGVKNTIAVASGKGGVGKSTVTVNLATALAQAGARVGILDADIYGPSIPLMLGHAQPPEISGEKYLPARAHGIQAMSIGYLTEGEPALIWRGPMLAKSLLQMIDITEWEELDYLFIDLPPGTGDIQLSLVQKIPLTAAIIVTTPQTVATLDAEKALKMFMKTNIHVLGIIENMCSHVCSQCGHIDAIFSHGGAETLCKTYETNLLGQLPLDSRIVVHADNGTPTALQDENDITPSFIKTAMNVAIALSNMPLNYSDRFPKIVVE